MTRYMPLLLLGDSALGARIAPLLPDWARDSTGVPIDSASSATHASDRYLHEFGPIAWLTLASLAGERAMGRFLQSLVAEPDQRRDHALFQRAALRSGIAPATWTRFEDVCVHRQAQVRCGR